MGRRERRGRWEGGAGEAAERGEGEKRKGGYSFTPLNLLLPCKRKYSCTFCNYPQPPVSFKLIVLLPSLLSPYLSLPLLTVARL
jgi:hypothetical protein